MANLTISVDDSLLKRARMRALEQNTSVNAILRRYLEAYVGTDVYVGALQAFIESAENSSASSGPEGRQWKRYDLYDG